VRNVVAHNPISLLICDDHRLLTEALAVVVGSSPDIKLLASPFDNAEELIDACARLRPDVVLMEVRLGRSPDGLQATRRIKRVSPSTKVLILTADPRDQLMLDTIEAGASGLLHKSEGVDTMLRMIRAASRGERLIDTFRLPRLLEVAAREREMRREAERRLGKLTERENQILDLLREGMRNDEIAARLYISPRTVETHVQNILRKLQVHSKLEAVAFVTRRETLSA
jgi:RNA polymerase sigma factor (sigma-70 family)